MAAAVAALLAGLVGAQPASAAATVVCHLQDPRIDEASGIAQGIASPQVLYVQNDSGDTNRFFALDARTCRSVATVTVPNARNVDWEDMAVARDAAGTPSVWLADTGDNAADRTEVTVYRVDEPRLVPGRPATSIRSGAADVWRLRYPGGPVDAEALAVTPRGVGYLVTKSLLGASTVYRLPPRPDPARVQQLTRVGVVEFTPTSPGGPAELARQVAATSAAVSPDGTRLAVRTYTQVYVWTVRDGDVAAALRTPPVRIALPAQPQGEGIDVASGRLLLDSEGRGSAVYSMPLPPARGAAASTAAPSSTQTTPPTSATPTTGAGGSGGGSWLPGIVVLTLLVLGAAAWWTMQLRGRASR